METMDKKQAAAMFREMLTVLGADEVRKMAGMAAASSPDKENLRSSEPVAIYALEDIKGPDGKVVHKRGHRQLVTPVDRREILRGGLYGTEPPAAYVPEVLELPPAMAPAAKSAPAVAPTPVPAALAPDFTLTALPGVNDTLARQLEDAGFGTLEAIRDAEPEKLATVKGMGLKMAQRAQEYVNDHYHATPKK